ncbi:PhzF family phenazine biosynthesis protein [Agrobacterium tumefaciens]|uniref:PhzF family phenazine biosynthesis protein n=1 Tax=Agrobacterium tumefaciens TaxID=358 RepID=UPI000DCF7ED0|nr:PhzF family phenazine biosynthesis protein [Agrobacterium tumefaciens]MDR6590287.1 PhzF family phenazine biosynthesis protein [Agrobacterium tumefaciens]UXS11973.1 PhzF family phenazine biosynthesis protein [Agrobacterium tumefaciens]UXS19341.1 PhzF family phenazine biosynthesis protein [Agrobacterium tumefaciens]UXT68039.1 PhzF family phenazine biosynthesis protein [Agrobacterium tumefaciens]
MSFAIHMIDVFGSGPLSGNPLAVVIGADALSTDEMQLMTRWFNLSETTFLLRPTHPQADYRVRIFSLDRELPFAGHPTLGSCHAWLSANGMPGNETAIVQECGAGLVTIRRSHGRLSFAAPPLIRSGAPTPAELEDARQFLGIEACDVIDAAWIDNGPGWLGIRMASAEKVLGITPARSWTHHIDIGVVGPHAKGGETAFEVRAFFSDHLGTIVEDPVTGSLNASLAQWLFATGVVGEDYVAAQGTRLGRHGRIYLTRDDAGQIWVGGETRTHVEGRLLGL